MSSIIKELPIELWNIILLYSDLKGSKNFIYMVYIYKVFNNEELIEINKKYIYDYSIASSFLNINIYKLYNSLNSINTKSKYISIYSNIFENMCYLDRQIINIGESFILRNYLESKISDTKSKQKFNNLTNRIIDVGCNHNNRVFSKMIKYL
tara:strand:+ start:638 stop:1093 length:456 start_codon:yes stop_codon:yes gene_type:complete